MTDAGYVDTVPSGFCPARLEQLRSLTGLSWVAFARELGVRHERVSRWREGITPNDRGMAALKRLAVRVPGGLDALFGGNEPEPPGAA